jgi:hypothetical protein
LREIVVVRRRSPKEKRGLGYRDFEPPACRVVSLADPPNPRESADDDPAVEKLHGVSGLSLY